ncbi:MogA/MoaB family molybdenum cofactor biosynthesis protein [Candidatus Bathyarchaeota archaeon]|nr:MogA/MoaB family molybdenum cofactor biosynthesis protein [Candidatus Bathyarchaeota archaeon]MBS7630810.1 MogA/MoaB family molybdenum cofactor biosynthesis protein [Candidatus Bathyarchaeota archaeon]
MEEHRRDQEEKAKVALLVTSDVRIPETDDSGKIAIQILEEAGHRVVAYMILKNDAEQIKEALRNLLTDKVINVIITSGGTGVSQKDVTVDAACSLMEKRVEGFGEFFRRLSHEQIGEAAILSRATAGVAAKKLIFCLPGSKNAISLGLRKAILPILGHMLWEVNR